MLKWPTRPRYLVDQVLIDDSDFGADFANARAAGAVLQVPAKRLFDGVFAAGGEHEIGLTARFAFRSVRLGALGFR
jgi:hypothetical protein